jgi:hypothetical protein
MDTLRPHRSLLCRQIPIYDGLCVNSSAGGRQFGVLKFRGRFSLNFDPLDFSRLKSFLLTIASSASADSESYLEFCVIRRSGGDTRVLLRTPTGF